MLLTPSGIIGSHLGDQLPKLGRHPRPSSGLRFPPPKQPKALAMPPDEGFGLNYGQNLAPDKQPGKQHQGQAGSGLRLARFDLALQVQSQLLAEEEILSRQAAPGLQTGTDEPR